VDFAPSAARKKNGTPPSRTSGQSFIGVALIALRRVGVKAKGNKTTKGTINRNSATSAGARGDELIARTLNAKPDQINSTRSIATYPLITGEIKCLPVNVESNFAELSISRFPHSRII
jgi:hypothetical protein